MIRELGQERVVSKAPWRPSGITLFQVLLVCCVVLAVAIVVYGSDYYLLDQVHRPFSPKHRLLKPGGLVGLRLGMAGFALLALVYVYALRKHWGWLSRRGETRDWLNCHVAAGLLGPALICFHSSFKFHGLAGIAFWIMIALVISGLIGRYLYAQIPRNLEAAQLLLRRLEETKAELYEQLNTSGRLPEPNTVRAFHLPAPETIARMSIFGATLRIILLDLLRPLYGWRLRRRFEKEIGSSGVLLQVLAITRQQARLSKKILFLSRAQSLFHLWHVVHRPFSYTFIVLVLAHLTVALILGFY
ncbi:MAG: hypothetical protein EHM61_14580 [Acidobacteria bacterium]|nr:MAG: hypothetical protein EHM61_14580 [Acidobacteriota bacterium]